MILLNQDIIEDFSTELNEIKTKPIYKNLVFDTNISKKDIIELFNKNQEETEKSIITDLFTLNLINKLICKCKKVTFSFHTIKDIPLLIDDKEEEVPLISLIKNYFKNEIVDYEEKCIFCNKIYPHEKITSIINLPEILILSLQRFNPETREKKNTKVIFDTTLNINPFADETTKDHSHCTYNLFSKNKFLKLYC